MRELMYALTSLGNWSTESIKADPELYRAYVRELAVEICEDLSKNATQWPKEWVFDDA